MPCTPWLAANDIIAWHYDHSKGRTVKGINILTAMVSYGDVRLPIAYEVIEKTIRYSDLQTKKERRKRPPSSEVQHSVESSYSYR
ncbi:hypothetical protein PsalN5692_01128 [Piscirickettsia salmonis]|nr:hypothetical protein [Piscirickettsia salmonis]QGP49676.1 hypothetical protein PsalN5692_01128 [Piscirickettsia salmonis]